MEELGIVGVDLEVRYVCFFKGILEIGKVSKSLE